MESTLLMSIAAISSFILYYGIMEETYLEPLAANYVLSANWEFSLMDCLPAGVVGIVAAATSLTILISIGVCKQLFFRLKRRCNETKFLNGDIVVGIVGGFLIGTNVHIVMRLFF